MGRIMEFRMEREGLVSPGDQVELKEDTLSTMAGLMYYYTIVPAVAMSNNTKKRLSVLKGTVLNVVNQDSVFTVTVDIPE